MPYDPALTAIAVTTNDALTEHLWRYDTDDTDSGDPIAEIAVELARAAHDFNTTAGLLSRMLTNVGDRFRWHATTLASLASINLYSLDIDAIRVVQQLERFAAQRESLLTLYGMWRRHRHTTRDARSRNLWLRPYDPSKGMVALSVDDTGLGWFVVPDQVAAEVHRLANYGALVGGIWHGSAGWQATAFTHPEHRATCAHLVYPLPPTDTEDAACRSLLRWWALRDSEQWQGRIPAELTAAEQAALVA